MATRNAAATLPQCLESLRAQAFRDFEVIVMDGASSDGTADVLRSHSDLVTRWRSEPDGGIYSAWNKAVELARGEWICFLGADDRLRDALALQRLVPHLRAALPHHRVVYSRLQLIGLSGEVVAEMGMPWQQAKASFRSHQCLPQPGLMHHRSLFEAHGRFDESFRIAADYEFLLRELKDHDARFVPVTTVAAGFGGLTTRPENFALMYEEIGRALAKHGLKPPAARWAWLTLSARLYRMLYRVGGDPLARRLADAWRVLTLRKRRYIPPSPE
jgi:glycosyltransferase involved in cell wall biosynthesis